MQRLRLEHALRELGWKGPPLPGGARILPERVKPYGDSQDSFPAWLKDVEWKPDENSTVTPIPRDRLFRRAASTLLNEALVDWWIENDWFSPFSGRSAADFLELLDVPVPVDSWDAFDLLFAWERRLLLAGENRLSDTTLGAGIRRFFSQGGRKCYVVRVGDPWPLFTGLHIRAGLRLRILRNDPMPAQSDRLSWRGVGHLLGLEDVSFLCIPDLPELFAVDKSAIDYEPPPEEEEHFIECAAAVTQPVPGSLRAFPVPRLDESGFREWGRFVGQISQLLCTDTTHLREIQFVAAVPLPVDSLSLSSALQYAASKEAPIETAFLQLVLPWMRTRESLRLPGGFEAPDGLLAGLLADTALTRGAWRSASRTRVAGIIDLEPILTQDQLEKELIFLKTALKTTKRPADPLKLCERISVFHRTPLGFQLLSDVTTDDDNVYRPANVNRLLSCIIRAARIAGQDAVFDNNDEELWRRLRTILEDLLFGLWSEGALAGLNPDEAYEVHCDRSTMTQANIDSGRLIAQVRFTTVSPVERIIVTFAMNEGGQVTLVSPQMQEALEASV